jgi:RHS repeat-associated protein
MVKDGATYRLVTDHFGSVRLVVDASTGSVAQRIDYDMWWDIVLNTRPGFQPFRHAGGLYYRETGLVRFGARDYDPWTGRWTTKDPIGFAWWEHQPLRAYAFEDPLNGADPEGPRSITISAYPKGYGGWLSIGLDSDGGPCARAGLGVEIGRGITQSHRSFVRRVPERDGCDGVERRIGGGASTVWSGRSDLRDARGPGAL